MEFKLGASLWGASADAKAMAPQQEPTADFGKKLGLAARQETPSGDSQPLPERDLAKGDQLDWQASLLQLAQRQDARSPAQVELYGWGSLAGHHLSHLRGSFEADGIPKVAPLAAQVSTLEQAAAPLPELGQRPHVGGTPLVVAALSLPGEVQPTEVAGALDQGQLAAFFTQRWPERRLLLLPRDNGTEVIIRDFHLSEEEQHRLAQDLQHLLQGNGEPLERIWVNGQQVWQREPIQ